MKAAQEKSDPNSCINRAAPDEPTFVLLGRDISAPFTIRRWVFNRIAEYKNKPGDAQIQDALKIACDMEEYRKCALTSMPKN